MSVRTVFISFAAFNITIASSVGDTFVTKSGDRIEGRAIDENNEVITVRKYIDAEDSITVARADLQEILPDTQETAEFLTILDSAAVKTAIGPDVFNQLIERKIPSFESKYPQSKYRADLDRLSDRLKQDKSREAAGNVKIAGVWLNRDQVNQEKYQVSAALLHESMEYSVAVGDWPTALNAFQNLRVNYQGSRAYVEAIDLAIEVLPQFRKALEEKLQGYRLELLRAYLNLAGTPDSVKQTVTFAARRETEQVEATINQQRRNGVRWPTTAPRSEKDFAALNDQITEELALLAKLPLAQYRASIDAANRAHQAVIGHDVTAAQADLNQARSFWDENEMIGRVTSQISIEEKTQADAAATERAEIEAAQMARASELAPPNRNLTASLSAVALLILGVCGWLAFRKTKRSRRRLIS
jgi:hypothetical protein